MTIVEAKTERGILNTGTELRSTTNLADATNPCASAAGSSSVVEKRLETTPLVETLGRLSDAVIAIYFHSLEHKFHSQIFTSPPPARVMIIVMISSNDSNRTHNTLQKS